MFYDFLLSQYHRCYYFVLYFPKVNTHSARMAVDKGVSIYSCIQHEFSLMASFCSYCIRTWDSRRPWLLRILYITFVECAYIMAHVVPMLVLSVNVIHDVKTITSFKILLIIFNKLSLHFQINN